MSLQGRFSVRVNTKVKEYDVVLNQKYLDLKPVDPVAGKRLELLGSRIMYCKLLDDENPIEKRLAITYCFNPDTLACKTYIFSAIMHSDKEENNSKVVLAETWLSRILHYYNIPRRYRSRRILIIVNPKSGKGNALPVHRSVTRIFDEIGLQYQVLITENQNHAKDFIKNEKSISTQWGSILVLSGDGGLHEVLNGIYGHEDWKYILQTIAIGAIPVGSGNALCRTLQYLQNEPKTGSGYFSALMNTVVGRPFPMDLFKVSMKGGATRLGFLSLGWGIIADLDIESEPLRFMGEARFTLWGLHRIANLRKYKGKLSYLPAMDHGSDLKYVDEDEDEIRKHDEEHKEQVPIPESFDEAIDEKGWTSLEDEFICIYIANIPFIDSNTFLAPHCKPNDGFLWLMIVHKEATKVDLLKVMATFENGEHVKVNNVDMVKVRAVRLTPTMDSEGKRGNLTIDGELLNAEGVQISILPSAARVMVK